MSPLSNPNPFDRLLAPSETPPDLSLPTPPPAQAEETVLLKRATFQLSETLLNDLDRYHLQWQLAQGKAHTPYKEVMVEAAIAFFLTSAAQNPKPWQALLDRWQASRRTARR